MIEVLVVLVLCVLLFGVVFEAISGVRFSFQRGTVNMMNLQEARLALAWLRRDFACALPRFDPSDGVGVLDLMRIRPLFPDLGVPVQFRSAPIWFSEKELTFYRWTFDLGPDDLRPRTELVRYVFSPGEQTLSRIGEDRTLVFKGIRKAAFQIYVHDVNPAVPLIWVKLEVLEKEGGPGGAPPLELSTSIGSAFVCSNLNHPGWNFTGFQKNAGPP